MTASSIANDGQESVAFAIHLANAIGTPDAQLVEGAVSMWLIDVQDLVQDLASAGFRIDQHLSAFSPDDAEAGGHRVVIVATRADELA